MLVRAGNLVYEVFSSKNKYTIIFPLFFSEKIERKILESSSSSPLSPNRLLLLPHRRSTAIAQSFTPENKIGIALISFLVISVIWIGRFRFFHGSFMTFSLDLCYVQCNFLQFKISLLYIHQGYLL